MLLIIGYGNTLRSDDGLGPYIAESLGELDAVIITCTQLSPELAAPISRATGVVFIDAAVGQVPGDVCLQHLISKATDAAFTHRVSPSSLLAAASELYGAAPPAAVISITGASFDYGETFSPIVRGMLPEIVSVTRSMIDQFSSSLGGIPSCTNSASSRI